MTTKNLLPPAETLWEYFSLDPFTGQLFWRCEPKTQTKQNPRTLLGTGTLMPTKECRYPTVNFDSGSYPLHRLIVKWMTGTEPGEVVEHIVDNQLDVRPWRLLSSNHRSNMATAGRLRKRDPLPTGVIKSGLKYKASIAIENQTYYLGTYLTVVSARVAYLLALQQYEEDPNWRPPKPSAKPKKSEQEEMDEIKRSLERRPSFIL